MITRRLGPSDAPAWKTFRLSMLRDVPEAFCALHDDLVDKPVEFFADWLSRYHCFVVEDDSGFWGSAAWKPNGSPVTRHRGEVSAVYVRPDARGKGVVDMLLSAVEADAKREVMLLELEVNARLTPALRAYQRNGWEVLARLPAHMKHGDVLSDAWRMVKHL
jgi:ribosomal protein S18 acetylase RimI-like enzyme